MGSVWASVHNMSVSRMIGTRAPPRTHLVVRVGDQLRAAVVGARKVLPGG